MSAHVIGIPIEETVLPLLPAGAAIITAIALVARTRMTRLRRRLRQGSSNEAQ
jgi:hypothetical protein